MRTAVRALLVGAGVIEAPGSLAPRTWLVLSTERVEAPYRTLRIGLAPAAATAPVLYTMRWGYHGTVESRDDVDGSTFGPLTIVLAVVAAWLVERRSWREVPFFDPEAMAQLLKAEGIEMGAFNWILVVEDCPACAATVTLRCQTHVASSFDGDAAGRFCHVEYPLGQAMRWWAPSDPRYCEWHVFGRFDMTHDPAGELDEEACHAECPRCRAKLVVVIQFEQVTPTCVLLVDLGDRWPAGYGP